VKYRIHNALLQVDGGKMGKSLGNAYTLADVEEHGYSIEDLRYFYYMATIFTTQNFSRAALDSAKSARTNLKKKVQKAVSDAQIDLSSRTETENIPSLSELAKKFVTEQVLIDAIDEAIKDNFNTPKLLSTLSNATNQLSPEALEVFYRLEKKFLKI
jgi:cysteinyl-tRNA synthetase